MRSIKMGFSRNSNSHGDLEFKNLNSDFFYIIFLRFRFLKFIAFL